MTRCIREQCIAVLTSDYHVPTLLQAIETYPITCVLWLGPTFFAPEPSLISVADSLRSRGGYQLVSRGDHTESVTTLLKSFGAMVDDLYQDGLIDISENITVEGIPDLDGRMTWVFSRPMSPDDLTFKDRHALFASAGFGCYRKDNRWEVDCSLDGFWIIQRDQAPIPFYREVTG